MDPAVQELIPSITSIGDPALDPRGHTATDVTITTRDGRVEHRQLDIAPGFPGNGLTAEQHIDRFRQCLEYAAIPLPEAQVQQFLAAAADLAALPDARQLVDTLIIA